MCPCLLAWNTCSTNRNMKVNEVCADENQRYGESRVGPEKHGLVTVQLQLRASQHKCSTTCTVIVEIGRDELNRILINENQRLRNHNFFRSGSWASSGMVSSASSASASRRGLPRSLVASGRQRDPARQARISGSPFRANIKSQDGVRTWVALMRENTKNQLDEMG